MDVIKDALKQEVLDLFNNDGNGPLLFDEIEEALRKKNIEFDSEVLSDVVKELLDDYVLYPSKKNRLGLLKQFHLYKGIIRMKKAGFGFFMSDELDEDAFIPIGDTMDSFDGDMVIANVNNEALEGKRREGKVIRIIKRNSDFIIGTVIKTKNGLFAIDCETNINVFVADYKTAVYGDIVKIKLNNKINTNQGYILGEIVSIIGNVNTPGMDELAIAYKYGFDEKFSEETEEEVINLVNEYNLVKDREIARRNEIKNLSDRRIITIDGDDAKDLDDAISITKLDNGNYRLGVYIADVSYFVKEGTKLNEDALKRATSVYLTDRVLPMLPFKLCNDLCSLNEHEDKLVMALEMEIDKSGEVVDYELSEGVINSTHRMTYNVVNQMLDGECVDSKYDDIKSDLKLMEELSLILRKNKGDRGSLDFDIPEAKIVVDENGHPIDVKRRERGEGERIIEDFMIMANETVATIVYNMELPFIYRVHDEPDDIKLAKFNKLLNNTAFKLKNYKASKSSNVTPMMLQRLLNEINEVDLGLSTMLLRMMAKAEYSTLNIGHFGLASKCYTHFTSPIRRYPDLIVHRLLKKYIINSEDFYSNKFNEEDELNKLDELAKICSEQERKATDCERDVEDYKMAEFMEDHIGEVFDGTISSVTNFGMFVRLPNLIEGLVAMRDMTDDYYIYDEDNMCLIGRSKHKKYKLGSKIKVKCVNASKESKQVDFIVSSDKINTGNSKGRKKNGRPIKGQTRRARKGGSHAKKR